MRVGHGLDLILDGLNDARMTVAEAGHCGAARGVHVALAFAVNYVRAFAAHCDGQRAFGMAVQDVRHGDSLLNYPLLNYPLLNDPL